jgi:hypothetical protein
MVLSANNGASGKVGPGPVILDGCDISPDLKNHHIASVSKI